MTHRVALFLGLWICVAALSAAQFADPFTPRAESRQVQDFLEVTLSFPVPEKHVLYADALEVELSSGTLKALEVPKPKVKYDPLSEKERKVYEAPFALRYALQADQAGTATLGVGYQGCDEQFCYAPAWQDFSFWLPGGAASSEAEMTIVPLGNEPVQATQEEGQTPAIAPPEVWKPLVEKFEIAGMKGGILYPDDFLRFAHQALAGEVVTSSGLAGWIERSGFWLQLLLVFAGGFLLNLTPCILPMIPINLMIIGAGAQAGSRGRGFALGAVYGLAMAATYGILGLLAVLAGASFGTLNSTVWFNFSVAAVFVFLGLAMMGVFQIDFTRFRGQAGQNMKAGSWGLALFMGSLSALLAGACVAPVLLSVLLVASNMAAEGQNIGMVLPFVLGLGMGAPWPLAGGGLSFLPKPGKWMNWVKYLFGLFILAMAAYYGYLGVNLLRDKPRVAIEEQAGWTTDFPAALREGLKTGKPVFVDFKASWCKNCVVVEKETFTDPEVREEMGKWVKVKIWAENFQEPNTKALIQHFEVPGLPTYVLLKPR